MVVLVVDQMNEHRVRSVFVVRLLARIFQVDLQSCTRGARALDLLVDPFQSKKIVVHFLWIGMRGEFMYIQNKSMHHTFLSSTAMSVAAK